ncbi:MAG: S8 family serine peptidase [Muribaculaceae bacterium]|nr:S8 family serine peptidase [Muribaculaceae bacterium]
MKKTYLWFVASILVLGNGLMTSAQSLDNSFYEAFIKVNDALVDHQLENAGVLITAKYNGFYTARVNAGIDPMSLKTVSGVEHVSPAVTLLTCCDSARYYSRVAKVHEGTNLDKPYTGKGVIVGVIDCGFDFNHINLCDDNGLTRVKAVYMPLDTTGNQPVIGHCQLPGSCYETPEEIAALTTDDPLTTHGTQTAGIAAGAYRENGWYGVAPDAEIVACAMLETELTDVRVANCISYIIDYANRVGKPCVINISLGSNVGPHDGSSYLVRVCEQFSGPGRVFVISAGNDGHSNVCMHTSIQNEQDTVTTLISGYGGGTSRSGFLSAWGEKDKPFSARLFVIDNQTNEWVYTSEPLAVSPSCQTIVECSTENDAQLAQYYKGRVEMRSMVEYNDRPMILCDMSMTAKNKKYVMGLQYFSNDPCDLTLWTSQFAYFRNYGYDWAQIGTSAGSINDLVTSDSIISVGSYNTRQTAPLRDGTIYWRSQSAPVEMSYFSAYGPDENGISRPDVCAPGSMVLASGNRYDTHPHNLALWQPSAFVDGVEYPYCPDLGTSMSAPVVAGAVALWMQANPNLTAADVRDILRRSSYKDEYVREGNPSRWGFGKLDVNAGMRCVLNVSSVAGDANGDGEVNISDISMLIDLILNPALVADYIYQADVNNDGEINISDISAVIDIILGL